MFVDGINVDSDIESYNNELSSEQNTYVYDSEKTYKNWISYINSNLEEVNQYNVKLNLLMIQNNISFEFIKKYLIEIDNCTLQELMDLDYVEDRIDTHLEDNNSDELRRYLANFDE